VSQIEYEHFSVVFNVDIGNGHLKNNKGKCMFHDISNDNGVIGVPFDISKISQSNYKVPKL
jgi:hypothetical protein